MFVTGIQALVRLPLDAAPARPRGRAEHGRLRHRLSRLAARRLRPAAGAGASRCSTRTTSSTSPASTRTSRPPPARARSRSGWTARAATTACSRSGTARAPASTARGDAIRHGNLFGTAAAWAACCCCWATTISARAQHDGAPERVRDGRRHGAGAEPGGRAGDPGVRPARHRHVALLRRLGGAQVHPRHGREHGLDPGRPGTARAILLPDDYAPPPGGLNIRWPDNGLGRRWRWRRSERRRTPTSWTPPAPSPAPTGSTGWCWAARAPGSAWSPPASPGST